MREKVVDELFGFLEEGVERGCLVEGCEEVLVEAKKRRGKSEKKRKKE